MDAFSSDLMTKSLFPTVCRRTDLRTPPESTKTKFGTTSTAGEAVMATDSRARRVVPVQLRLRQRDDNRASSCRSVACATAVRRTSGTLRCTLASKNGLTAPAVSTSVIRPLGDNSPTNLRRRPLRGHTRRPRWNVLGRGTIESFSRAIEKVIKLADHTFLFCFTDALRKANLQPRER